MEFPSQWFGSGAISRTSCFQANWRWQPNTLPWAITNQNILSWINCWPTGSMVKGVKVSKCFLVYLPEVKVLLVIYLGYLRTGESLVHYIYCVFFFTVIFVFYSGLWVNGMMFRVKAKEFSTQFKALLGWYHIWKCRHSISMWTKTGHSSPASTCWQGGEGRDFSPIHNESPEALWIPAKPHHQHGRNTYGVRVTSNTNTRVYREPDGAHHNLRKSGALLLHLQ